MLTKKYICILLPLFVLLGLAVANSASTSASSDTGTLEKMIVANGKVTMDVDLARLAGAPSAKENSKIETLNFGVDPDSFFTVLVFNNVLRAPLPGSLELLPQNSGSLSKLLGASFKQLVVEKTASDQAFDFVVRDGKTGFVFFNVDGHSFDYDSNKHLLNVTGGRLLISDEFAKRLGRSPQDHTVAGKISVSATLYPIEIDKEVNGTVQSAEMPAHRLPAVGTVPGPDVIVGDLPTIAQGGSSGGFVGLGVATTSCNAGVENLNWFALPNSDHPVIPQNMYRMSGGTGNTDRFEQIGQSWLKHAFTALTENICNYGCNNVGGTHLGSGCSDPYSASLNYGNTNNSLGSRAWVNPYTGAFPGSSPNPNTHTGHTHTGTSHRLLVAITDLDPAQNPGATYFAEGQYVTPHEYAWCQTHHGECNMNNNVSYRQFTPTGTTNFTFGAVGATVRMTPAIFAWTGATINVFEPDTGNDGIGFVGCKVTNPTAGVWHYEYAVYNQNLDRAIQSFSVPLGCNITASNLGFHAPPQHPGWANDGTLNNAGYSSTAWTSNQTSDALTWNSQTFAANQNANAIRWGTLYNFRFDSNRPPQSANATVGFFKTGAPITVVIQAPTPDNCNPLNLVSAVSRKTHGDAGAFDVDLPLSGTPGLECRSGGESGDYTVVFRFTNAISAVDDASVSGAGATVFSRNVGTDSHEYVVNLTGVLNAQQLSVTLTGVHDSLGNTMPSTATAMNVLVGDTSGDGAVNSADIAQVKGQSGNTMDASNAREDVNDDGILNSADISLVKSKSGTGLQ